MTDVDNLMTKMTKMVKLFLKSDAYVHLQAVKEIRKFDLSVALFAHGWTSETAGSWDQFIDNECRSADFFLLCFILCPDCHYVNINIEILQLMSHNELMVL